MKTILCTLALCLSALTGWADTYTLPFKQLPAGAIERSAVARVIDLTKHGITIKTPPGTILNGGRPIVVTGAYYTYTDDASLLGTGTHSGGSGGGGGGKHDHGPANGGGIQVVALLDLAGIRDSGIDISNQAWGIEGVGFMTDGEWHPWSEIKVSRFYADETGSYRWWETEMIDGLPQGFTLSFLNTATGGFTNYVIAIPFVTGYINFTGSDINGYLPTAVDIKVGSFSISGPKKPATNPQVFRHVP